MAFLSRRATSIRSQLLVLTTSVGIASALVKNVGALAMLMPAAFQMAKKNGANPSVFLMPMSFASLLGGLMTLVGTSPNIIVSRDRQRLGSAEWVPHMQTFGNLATKLLRTSQGQMETLACMRRGGEQVVRHVHVDNRGGQAVIAENVQTGGQRNGKTDDQSHATGAAGIGPALLGAHPFRNEVPIPSREGAEAVPYARGHKSGCA